MRVRFWGTRGSLAKPGPTTVRYGGNTACVEVRAEDGTLVVLDCGTGAHELGQSLVAAGERPIRGHLLITHTHWDHIQGFPFFAPLFIPGNEWDIYAPGGLGQRLEDTLSGQMEYTYFPVTLGHLGATIRFHDLAEGTFQIGGVSVTARYLNHPAVVLGYRLEADGVSLVYATDHEPHAPDLLRAAPDGGPVHEEDRKHLDLLRNADLLIHDAQYTQAEYAPAPATGGGEAPAGKRGWGHTAVEHAAEFAVLARVDQLALFHHDPTRDDSAVDDLVVGVRKQDRVRMSGVQVFGAAEGMEVRLTPRSLAPASPVLPSPAVLVTSPMDGAASNGSPEGLAGETVLIADDDPDILSLVADILEPEDGLRVLFAGDGDAALSLALTARPSLILLDWQMPGRDGLSVLRALRGSEDAAVRDIPVVLLTARARQEDAVAGFEAGATDYLTKPFTPAHVRSRVQEWLMRARQIRASRDAAPGGITGGAAGNMSGARGDSGSAQVAGASGERV